MNLFYPKTLMIFSNGFHEIKKRKIKKSFAFLLGLLFVLPGLFRFLRLDDFQP